MTQQDLQNFKGNAETPPEFKNWKPGMPLPKTVNGKPLNVQSGS